MVSFKLEGYSVVEQTHTQTFQAASSEQSQTLRDNVEKALQNYFAHLDGQPVTDLYQLVLAEVEAPLLESVMSYTKDNQTKASTILGLNRGTLRKKLKQYGML
ncbi:MULTISPECIES: DNA-binding transcriptional regulator Fis [Marinomonas]|jgi:Fis family transcriptional regulator|uniref:Putative Fis-like DNA-binding protein n=1 Tax=Marinomonas pollencensis TaxID=491954 RepID=A0A3E0DNA0_9GAMM|nr:MULTISPECIES: DNA-binding transcriptional regulator Fis [Marinomonas]REG84317.1 DNA-binding protein Fis [Marinomonas pollencensis]